MTAQLSPRQAEILAFINIFRFTEQANPTGREISERFGWRSINAAHEHLQALEAKGVIERRPTGRYVVVQPYEIHGVVT